MPRLSSSSSSQGQHRLSQSGGGGGGNAVVAGNIMQTMASKESLYQEGVTVNHSLCKLATNRLKSLQDNLLPQFLENYNNNNNSNRRASSSSPDEFVNYFETHKAELQSIAEQNIERTRTVQSFCHALRAAREECLSSSSQHDKNYGPSIVRAMKEHQESLNGVDLPQEALYQEISQCLGSDANNNPAEDDFDKDGVAISEQLGGASGSSDNVPTKCPITQLPLTDAVRNTVCGHVYSAQGIAAHMKAKQQRGHNCSCPVFGCGNTAVTAAQLKEDLETNMRVRRAVRHEEHRKQVLAASQGGELMDSDDE